MKLIFTQVSYYKHTYLKIKKSKDPSSLQINENPNAQFKSNDQLNLYNTWNIGEHQIEQKFPTDLLCMSHFTKKNSMLFHSRDPKSGRLGTGGNH